MPWADSPRLETQYLCLTWYPPADEIDESLAFVHSLAITGFEYEDGRAVESPFTDIPLMPGRPFVRIYLPVDGSAAPGEAVRQFCRERRLELEHDAVHTADWANSWKAYYHPESVACGYVVVPAWYDESPADAAHTLWIDPGMAFGTGTHATTRMCLDALAQLELKGRRVLDLGAGSGILGLFAALRGASRVVLVEPDPVAVDAVFHNARINEMERRIEVVAGTLAAMEPTGFDILCLNLIWDIIAAEWDRIQRYLAPGATLLLSGLLEEKGSDVEALVSRTGQSVVRMQQSEGWLLVEVRHDSDRG